MRKYILIAFLLFSSQIFAQKEIDGVRAIVGNEIILTSDIETQYQQYLAQGYANREEIKCQIIEDLLYQKLLLNQAKIDSLEISEQEIESELEKRIRYFVGQVGSKEKLEEFYGKSIIEIKSEFRDLINEQLLSQRMQGSITADVKVTPSEVKTYFNNLAKDSLPTIEAEVEISQIVLKPEISQQEKERVKNKLKSFKERLQNGEDFKVLAALYSDDPGSAKNGGELGFVGRGDLVPAFEAAAYKLKGDEISNIIKSEFGYHIIQLIERRGEQINVRHILLKPKVSSTQLMELKSEIEDIAKQIADEVASMVGKVRIDWGSGSHKKKLEAMMQDATTPTRMVFTQPSGMFRVDRILKDIYDINTGRVLTGELEKTDVKVYIKHSSELFRNDWKGGGELEIWKYIKYYWNEEDGRTILFTDLAMYEDDMGLIS